MVKPARKQFNFPLNHSLVHSRTNEVMENFSYMIFMFTLHKHTCSNDIDKFQVYVKKRKGEETVVYGRLYAKTHLFVRMTCIQTHSATCTFKYLYIGKK